MPAEGRPASYRIGDLTLDLVRRSVRRRGEPLPCGKLTFELLALLAERAPGVVSREDVVEQLWAGRYVSAATVKQRVSLLRHALGDRADDPKYVRVVRGHGYALIPNVQPVDAKRARPAGWKRFACAAGIVSAAFVVGAEVGYKDGLRPKIPDLDDSVSILVTNWPMSSGNATEFDDELPLTDYSFVMGVAERILTVLEDADFAGKLSAAYVPRGEARAEGSLSVVASASARDRETISVRLTVLNESLSDNRLARIYAMESWSRALRKAPEATRPPPRLAPILDSNIRPVATSDDDIRIFLPSDDRSFMLIAAFDFNRGEIEAHPRVVQVDAARSIAMAIDERVPGMDVLGAL